MVFFCSFKLTWIPSLVKTATTIMNQSTFMVVESWTRAQAPGQAKYALMLPDTSTLVSGNAHMVQ
jgi:hypothetical protein